MFVSCPSGDFLWGSQGGQVCPPWLHIVFGTGRSSGQRPEICFWAVFAIFSGLIKIIPVLGIRVLVSAEYLKTLYILHSEW
jgi:hypothetical protein